MLTKGKKCCGEYIDILEQNLVPFFFLLFWGLVGDKQIKLVLAEYSF